MTKTTEPCVCGSQKPAPQCCQPLLDGKVKAATPEALMRSRYAAFCQGNIAYLIATHHPSQRQPDDAQTLQATIATTEWLGLQVLHAAPTAKTDQIGFVEFAAFYQRGTFGQLHERSKFIKEDEQWYYLDGELLPPITLGRNDLCWCGSGKKYKKCHGR